MPQILVTQLGSQLDHDFVEQRVGSLFVH
jgi:hypothetical protein